MYEPHYTITPKLLTLIGKIEASKEVIENAPLIPQWERQFKNDAEVRTVHYSTHIEENPLQLAEVKKVLTGKEGDVVARERDLQEILNYREAMKFIDKYVEAHPDGQIDEKTIRELNVILTNRVLPPEKQGQFRVVPATTRNSITGEIGLIAVEAPQIPARIRDFTTWLASTSSAHHPVLKAGLVHYEMTIIHPFYEANGRTSRALATLSLYLDGYNIRRFFSLEEYYDHDPAAYYGALRSGHSGDLTTWLEYFSEGLAIELNRVKERVLKLSRDTKLRKTVGQIALSERQERIIEQLQDTGFMQNKDFRNMFPNISEDTVLREIKDLLVKGLIVKRGSTKGARYVLR